MAIEEHNRTVAEKTGTPPEWLVVVVTAGGRGMTDGLLKRLATALEGTSNRWALVDTAPDFGLQFETWELGGEYLGFPSRPFSLPRCFNLAAGAFRTARRYLFLHDDITLPEDPAANLFGPLAAALDASGVNLAVPRITGDRGNAAQAAGEFPVAWYPVSEYIASAAVAVDASWFWRLGGFDERMDGYEWSQIELQHRFAKAERCAIAVPAAVIGHIGAATYGRAAGDDRKDPRLELWRKNLERFCDYTGSGKPEYSARPKKYPSPGGKLPGARTTTARCASLIDDEYGCDRTVTSIQKGDDIAEIVVIDGASNENRRQRFLMATALQSIRVLYAPAWDSDPVRQAINLTSCVNVRLMDYRAGAPYPVVPEESVRLRVGDDYNIPSRMTEIHLGSLADMGLGDTIALSTALRVFRRRYPHIKTILHHCWDAADVLRFNPDLDEIRVYTMAAQHPPIELFDLGTGFGTEGMLRSLFHTLGLDDESEKEGARKLWYFIQPDERQAARDYLSGSLGADILDKPPVKLYGVQLHGGWHAKYWTHSPRLIERLLEDENAIVIAFGIDEDRMPEILSHPRVLRPGRRPIREIIALISLLDVLVGYDSGLVWAAAAVGASAVSLWGPNNPRGYVADTKSPNQACIRKRTPQMCHAEYGVDCRMVHGGSRCPFRQGAPGGDCLDEITVDEVLAEMADLPQWEQAISKRH